MKEKPNLTSLSRSSGWAAKLAPGPLAQVLCQLTTFDDPNLLSAAIPFADAGIYRLNDEQALVQSVDFFTPVVDDPADYGRIAAANALSDIYAVGGRPLTAMNLCGFPPGMEDELVAVLNGGAEKVAEAGAVVVGGHTVEDQEPKFGLAVTGLVDPRRMLSPAGAEVGDELWLSKPLGTGILTTALKGGLLTAAEIPAALTGMRQLNDFILELLPDPRIHACTDITGFGLLGHGHELAAASGVGLTIEFQALPVYPRVAEMAEMGLIPAGNHRNRDYYAPHLQGTIGVEQLDLLADPQTSGGLLLTVEQGAGAEMAARAAEFGVNLCCIGRVQAGPPGSLTIR